MAPSRRQNLLSNSIHNDSTLQLLYSPNSTISTLQTLYLTFTTSQDITQHVYPSSRVQELKAGQVPRREQPSPRLVEA